MSHTAVGAAIAAALVLASAGAIASGTSDATLSDLRIQLVDLDPGDGIAPTVSFDSAGGGSFVAVENTSKWGNGAFANISAGITGGPVGGTASISGNILSGLKLQTTAYTNSTVENGFESEAFQFLKMADDSPLPFTLSANTRMVVSGHAVVNAETTLTKSDILGGEVFLALVDTLEDAFAGKYSGLAILTAAAGLQRANPISDHEHADMSISFTNATDASATGLFSVAVLASADTLVPVPEPGSGGLMVAGLGLVGLMLRRRRGRRGRRGLRRYAAVNEEGRRPPAFSTWACVALSARRPDRCPGS
jgi:hypothetical protein